MSHSNVLAVIETLIASASLCVACLIVRSGLPARDVEISLRVLIRTRSVESTGVCDSCQGAMPAFKGTIPT